MKRVRSDWAPKSKAEAVLRSLCAGKSQSLFICVSVSVCPLYYIYILLYIYPRAFCRLSVTMDSSCAKTSSNGPADRTAHGLVSPNQGASRRDVIMVRQNPPVSSYYGTGPFNFTISPNSVNSNSITSILGLNDGKTCPLSINTSVFLLHKELTKSHSIPNPNLGCARYPAKSLTSVLKLLELARSVNYRAHLVKPYSGWEVHLQPYNGTQ